MADEEEKDTQETSFWTTGNAAPDPSYRALPTREDIRAIPNPVGRLTSEAKGLTGALTEGAPNPPPLYKSPFEGMVEKASTNIASSIIGSAVPGVAQGRGYGTGSYMDPNQSILTTSAPAVPSRDAFKFGQKASRIL